MAKSKNAVPAGFKLAEGTTKVGDLEYAIQYRQCENLDALREYYTSQGHNADEVILGIWNAANKQNASQSPKTAIRGAVDSGEYKRGQGDDAITFKGDEAVAAAIEDAQETTRTFVTGAPRQSDGFTKAKAHGMGERVARAFVEKHGRPPTDEEVDEVLAALL